MILIRSQRFFLFHAFSHSGNIDFRIFYSTETVLGYFLRYEIILCFSHIGEKCFSLYTSPQYFISILFLLTNAFIYELVKRMWVVFPGENDVWKGMSRWEVPGYSKKVLFIFILNIKYFFFFFVNMKSSLKRQSSDFYVGFCVIKKERCSRLFNACLLFASAREIACGHRRQFAIISFIGYNLKNFKS